MNLQKMSENSSLITAEAYCNRDRLLSEYARAIILSFIIVKWGMTCIICFKKMPGAMTGMANLFYKLTACGTPRKDFTLQRQTPDQPCFNITKDTKSAS